MREDAWCTSHEKCVNTNHRGHCPSACFVGLSQCTRLILWLRHQLHTSARDSITLVTLWCDSFVHGFFAWKSESIYVWSYCSSRTSTGDEPNTVLPNQNIGYGPVKTIEVLHGSFDQWELRCKDVVWRTVQAQADVLPTVQQFWRIFTHS